MSHRDMPSRWPSLRVLCALGWHRWRVDVRLDAYALIRDRCDRCGDVRSRRDSRRVAR